MPNGATVVDVGANIGTLTVPFAKMVGHTGTVHAFEPFRRLFQAPTLLSETQASLANRSCTCAFARSMGYSLEAPSRVLNFKGNDRNDR